MESYKIEKKKSYGNEMKSHLSTQRSDYCRRKTHESPHYY